MERSTSGPAQSLTEIVAFEIPTTVCPGGLVNVENPIPHCPEKPQVRHPWIVNEYL